MSKVLLVDFYAKGHNRNYIKHIIKANYNNDVVAIYPEDSLKNTKVYKCEENQVCKSIFKYILFISELKKILFEEQPDIVHFLTGDKLYRFFGIGLYHELKNCKSIVTFHHLRTNGLRKMSLKHICRSFDKCVVHSEELENQLNELKIDNVEVIHYPHFNKITNKSKDEIRDELGIPKEKFVFGAFGGTRYDKGLDLLIQAMKKIVSDNKNTLLLIAGKEVDFSKDYIKDNTFEIEENIKIDMRPIPDELYEEYLKCVDVIVLPYRSSFNGASGPLNEGVIYGKQIVGPSHGNLGACIEKYKLGKMFISEDIVSLEEALQSTYSDRFLISDEYKKYKNMLSVDMFYDNYRKLYKN